MLFKIHALIFKFLEENYSRDLVSFNFNLLYFSDLVKNQENITLIQQDA